MTIYFDMDGTIADLYSVENWLPKLRGENPTPYRDAKPLVNMRVLARVLHTLQNEGVDIGIISWLSRNGSEEYNKKVTATKIKWLQVHLGSVEFNEIHILPYGVPKSTVAQKGSILFDDEMNNRKEFMTADDSNMAFDVDNIIEILKNIIIKK